MRLPCRVLRPSCHFASRAISAASPLRPLPSLPTRSFASLGGPQANADNDTSLRSDETRGSRFLDSVSTHVVSGAILLSLVYIAVARRMNELETKRAEREESRMLRQETRDVAREARYNCDD